MSAKNSFNSMDPKAMQALLAVASRKLGTTPDVLKGQLEREFMTGRFRVCHKTRL